MNNSCIKLFLHLPKCAGTSIRVLLSNLFQDRIIEDYESYYGYPLKDRFTFILASLLQDIQVDKSKIVYGHFFPIKYIYGLPNKDVKLVTILRDPIDRLISHFRYWKSGDFSSHYLWRQMMYEHWSFMDFAMNSELRNFYTQYLVQVPLAYFSYIGLYENLISSVPACLQALGEEFDGDIKLPVINVTQSEVRTKLTDNELSELRDYHAEDYCLYHYAKLRYHTKCSPYYINNANNLERD